jgi:hypothetical protein
MLHMHMHEHTTYMTHMSTRLASNALRTESTPASQQAPGMRIIQHTPPLAHHLPSNAYQLYTLLR